MTKIGRPTSDPKLHQVTIRLTNTDFNILDSYKKKFGVNTSEAISHAIKELAKKK